MLTPGFLTDTLGAILLIPPFRSKIAGFMIEYLKKRSTFRTTFEQYPKNTSETKDEKIYEGKYEEIKKKDKKKSKYL